MAKNNGDQTSSEATTEWEKPCEHKDERANSAVQKLFLRSVRTDGLGVHHQLPKLQIVQRHTENTRRLGSLLITYNSIIIIQNDFSKLISL